MNLRARVSPLTIKVKVKANRTASNLIVEDLSTNLVTTVKRRQKRAGVEMVQ